ncbi:hypothetical protein BG20_I2176, partial [Candidatus Nitrosarchaeum limnium BG20]
MLNQKIKLFWNNNRYEFNNNKKEKLISEGTRSPSSEGKRSLGCALTT